MASRLPLRSNRQIPRFLRLTMAVRRQLAASEGLVGYSLLAQPTKKTYWTLSAWVDDEHVATFARTMPHVEVMRQLRPHMAPTTFVTWTVPGTALPLSWADTMARLRSGATPERATR